MKNVELVLSPALYPFRETKENHTTVVVDVLRATTSICSAIQSGAIEVIPLDSLDPLPHYRELGYSLAAERNAQKVMGAEYGNSPTEYMRMDLNGKRLAYSTTNGTVGLILAAQDSAQVIAGCFSNINALAKYLMNDTRDLVILCSGWKKGVSIEDTLFAGGLIKRLMPEYNLLDDASHLALEAYSNALPDLYSYCQFGSHIQRLQRMNYDADIRFAFQENTCPVIPIMKNGAIVPYKG